MGCAMGMSLMNRAPTQVGVLPHLHPNASPRSAVELSISKTALDLKPWEQLREKSTTSKRWEMDEEQCKRTSGHCSMDMTGGKEIKEQRGMSRVDSSCPPTSLIHLPNTACASHKDIRVFWGETMNTEWPKRKAKGFRRKWALMWELSQRLRKLKMFSILAWMMISRF